MFNRARLLAPLALLSLLAVLAAPTPTPAQEPPAAPPIVGRWDLTIHGSRGDYPSWLEVWTSGGTHLVGQFVGSGGSARPISRVEFADGTVRFAIPPQWDKRPDDETYEATLHGDALEGWTTDRTGKRLTFGGKRAPSLARTGTPAWGEPVSLIAQSDLTGWRTPNKGWTVSNGVLKSVGAADNLVSTATFNDFKVHVEFRLPKGSNSGVYLRGRYEVQIEDSDADEPPLDRMGGIYGFLAPTWDTRRQPGAWQTYDVTLVGRVVTVEMNGTRVICDREIPGITGGALDSDEASPGPLMLQGDHGAIEFRNIVVTPAR
jgi:3-keto-disaccharide hydrolase